MYRSQFITELELGWRAAGAMERENEGPAWMRLHTLRYRSYELSDYGGAKTEWHERRPSHQMM